MSLGLNPKSQVSNHVRLDTKECSRVLKAKATFPPTVEDTL